MSATHANKRAKPNSTSAAPLFTDIELSKLVIDTKLQGTEIKFASIKYDKQRLAFQLVDATGSLRVPFGLDDGTRFSGGKPSMRLELPPSQLAFVEQVEAEVKQAAVENKKAWFDSIKPPPTDEAILKAFTSRVALDDKYPASLKVNVNLGPDSAKKVKVSTTRRLANGKLTQPKEGSPDQVNPACSVIPMLRTAGGVWIRIKAKKGEFEYGLSFEASELLVVEENTRCHAGINLGNLVESEEEEEGSEASEGDFA